MFRFAYVILLAVHLLACPFRCQSCQVAAQDHAQPACCCCEHQDADEDNQGDNRSPERDCSCPNCICEGATISIGPEIPEADWHQMFGPWIASLSEVQEEKSAMQLSMKCPKVFHSGCHDALIAHEVWLI